MAKFAPKKPATTIVFPEGYHGPQNYNGEWFGPEPDCDWADPEPDYCGPEPDYCGPEPDYCGPAPDYSGPAPDCPNPWTGPAPDCDPGPDIYDNEKTVEEVAEETRRNILKRKWPSKPKKRRPMRTVKSTPKPPSGQ